MIDVNTRVDVLMLGYFTNEIMVGIYSMASMIADGFTQLPVIFRNIINPYITNYYYSDKREDLALKMIYGRNLTYKFLIPIGVLIIIVYPFALLAFGFYENYISSILPFALLMVGAIISIGYAPFLMIFNQTGHPGIQSLLYFLIFGINLILNYIFIPLIGINGAALATGISYISLLVFVKILTKRVLNLSF
jgi:O-antigen/teichoic acid export membrane protein